MAEDGTTYIPAYKDAGTWITLPAEAFDTTMYGFTPYDISENGMYIAGQINTPDFAQAWGFIYNIETEVLTILSSDLYEYGAAYAVNNNGLAAGWVDDLPEGTVRMPAVFSADGSITLISEEYGEAAGINNLNMVVGNSGSNAFIYSIDAEEISLFAPPAGQTDITFTDISDNGVAIGYASMIFDRLPVIYHEILDANPLLLSDVLAQFGIDAADLVGTAYRISSDGNYIGGWGNGPAFMAPGWAVYFDDLLLVESECSLTCPENITVDAALGEASVVVSYEVGFTCENEIPEGVEVVLSNGLPSGSAFPIGTTTIFHQLLDSAGEVMNSCSFTVTVNDAYCTPGYDVTVEPITYVGFAGIENETSAELNTQPAIEYFLDIQGVVQQGTLYQITLEGNTGGDYVNYFSAFADWNQDGDFDDANETYLLGNLQNSSGTDGQQVLSDIEVPADALTGTTRLRIVKNYNNPATDPCGMYSYGQTEEYTLLVEAGTSGINSIVAPASNVYPNPATDMISIESAAEVSGISVTNILGQQVLTQNRIDKGQIDISGLTPGVYLNVKIEFAHNSRIVRLVKK